MNYFKLKNGIELPALCFGPGMVSMGLKRSSSLYGRIHYKVEYKLKEKKYANAIRDAIDLGYTFIDHSISYGHEKLFVKAIRDSSRTREKLILTTRISNHAQYDGTIRESFFKYLKELGTDYIDLLMFHWPVTGHYLKTWNEMVRLKREGYCRFLGVANCNEHHLNELMSNSDEMPLIDQFEVHPLFTQKPLIKFCQEKGIQVEAYTPLARFDERMTRLPLLRNMCLKYNKSLAQLILRWHVQNGVIPVFRSLNRGRLMENINIFDFELSDADMRAIDSININSRLRYDPDNCDFTIL